MNADAPLDALMTSAPPENLADARRQLALQWRATVRADDRVQRLSIRSSLLADQVADRDATISGLQANLNAERHVSDGRMETARQGWLRVDELSTTIAGLRAEVAAKDEALEIAAREIDRVHRLLEARDEQIVALAGQREWWRVVVYDDEEVECRHNSSVESLSAAVSMAMMLNGSGYMVQIIDKEGHIVRKYAPVPGGVDQINPTDGTRRLT